MELNTDEKPLWMAVGTGLSHGIFERFERFEDAVAAVLDDFNGEGLAVLREILERMLESGEDARVHWASSGAGIAFNDAKGARMGLAFLLEAVKARQIG